MTSIEDFNWTSINKQLYFLGESLDATKLKCKSIINQNILITIVIDDKYELYANIYKYIRI